MSGKKKPRGVTPITSYDRPLSRSVEPITDGLSPSRPRQNPSLTIATVSAPGWASAAAKDRPNAGWTPSIGRTAGPTHAPDSVSPWSPHENGMGARKASIDSNERLRACQSARSKPEIPRRTESSFVPQMKTNCDGSLYGKGRNSTASTMLKIRRLTAIPRVSDATATAVQPGALAKRRTAYRTSDRICSLNRQP